MGSNQHTGGEINKWGSMTRWFLSVPCPVSNLELAKSGVSRWKPLSVNPLWGVNRSEPKPPRQVTLNHRVGGSSPSRRTK